MATDNPFRPRFSRDPTEPNADLGGPIMGIVFAGLALVLMLLA